MQEEKLPALLKYLNTMIFSLRHENLLSHEKNERNLSHASFNVFRNENGRIPIALFVYYYELPGYGL